RPAVPEQKTGERYDRLWPLVARARELADTTRFTTTRTTPRLFRRSRSTGTADGREARDGRSGHQPYGPGSAHAGTLESEPTRRPRTYCAVRLTQQRTAPRPRLAGRPPAQAQ